MKPAPGDYYSFDPFNLIVYVTDQTLGISDISLNKGIYGGNGEIIISSDRSQIIKIFNLSGQKVTSVAVQAHWYHVSLKRRHEGRFVAYEEMLNDEPRLVELLVSQDESMVIQDVQVVTPAWMNKGSGWKMEKLKSLSMGFNEGRSADLRLRRCGRSLSSSIRTSLARASLSRTGIGSTIRRHDPARPG